MPEQVLRCETARAVLRALPPPQPTVQAVAPT